MPLLHRSSWFLVALLPLACAVATEPELRDDGDSPRAGTASISGSSSAGTTSVGSTSASGGTAARAGTNAGGSSPMAGKPSVGGAGSSGSSSGGKGGTATAGAGGKGGGAGAGTAGSTGTGCGGLKTWKGGDSTLQIAQGEVIQWMGKRYKATTTIAYPNNECAPDEPVDWCASWFEADGDC